MNELWELHAKIHVVGIRISYYASWIIAAFLFLAYKTYKLIKQLKVKKK